MTTKKELRDLKEIIDHLIKTIQMTSTIHKQWGSIDKRGRNFTSAQTYEAIRELGYTLGSTYHAHGIGNNNCKAITRRFDVEGYTSEVIIGYINYNYDIYCRLAHIYIEDKDHTVIWNAKNQFPRLHSENE